MNRLIALSTLLAASIAGGLGLSMGPPIICNSIDCGEVASLPPDKPGKGEAAKVVATLPKFLNEEKSILAHMEALRRATLVLQGDDDAGTRLFASLACRTLNAEAGSGADATAWFDLAFYIACLNQMGGDTLPKDIAEADGVRGYGYMKKALALATDKKPGEMEYGAALMVHPVMRTRDHHMPTNPGTGKDIYDQHLRNAAAWSKPGSLLEKNLGQHLTTWGGSLNAVRAAAK